MMTSLRLRLFLIILLPLVLIAVGVGAWRITAAEETARDLFDKNLLVTALAVSRDVAIRDGDAISPETAALLAETGGGAVKYHVYAPDGVFVTGFASPPIPVDFAWDNSKTFAYFDAVSRGADVRVLRLQYVTQIAGFSGPFKVTVWQDKTARQAFVRAQVTRALTVMAMLIGTTAVVVWFGVNLGLKPLLDLEDAISRRSPADLKPIQRSVPVETQGLVDRINVLFGQLAASMDAQAAFISDAAHQLRNPIAGLRALGESILTARSLDTAQSRAADLVRAAAGAGDLAESLMTLERARATPDAALATRAELGALARGVVEKLRTDLDEGAPELLFQGLDLPVHVLADVTMVEEALKNLLHNALVHGGPKLSRITVTIEATSNTAIIAVTDNGRGVDPANFDKIRARFGQADAGEGSGLGLSIADAVARSHKGRLDIRPTDAGFSVALVFPRAPDA
ncbi:ATP-binding protein [Thalassococcus sp. BH17M4-6]|uniref:ATP-binding protein n=1 Tax=Thalassococcus sp. BH17M4-6 TaxID=3413148 RepID=UPI003BD1C3D0